MRIAMQWNYSRHTTKEFIRGRPKIKDQKSPVLLVSQVEFETRAGRLQVIDKSFRSTVINKLHHALAHHTLHHYSTPRQWAHRAWWYNQVRLVLRSPESEFGHIFACSDVSDNPPSKPHTSHHYHTPRRYSYTSVSFFWIATFQKWLPY